MPILKQTALAVALLALPTLAQSQDYIEKIADKACGCMSEITEANTAQVINMKLGVCMLNAAKPYAQQLKKDYNIDLNSAASLQAEGRKLGEVIGLKAAAICPEALVKLTELSNQNGADTQAATLAESTYEGQVTEVSDQQFVTFTVRDANGKMANFLWLQFFQSDLNLSGGAKTLLHKKVTVTYREEEYFDPRIKEYKKFKVITSLSGS